MSRDLSATIVRMPFPALLAKNGLVDILDFNVEV